MIPISGDEKLTHDYDGVKYLFYPPVGNKEKEIFQAFERLGGNSGNAYYDQAAREIDQEYKGKSFKKGERADLIRDRIRDLVAENNNPMDISSQVEGFNDFLDMVLCGWESDNKAVPPFPNDGKPSRFLLFGLKNHLVEWYSEQLGLTDKEEKN